jgi:large subunit ribosomal protein L9
VKVILLSDIERVGTRGTVVSVKNGYARNYLFPRRLALEATAAQLRQLESIKAQLASKDAKITKRLTDFAGQLGLVTVKTSIKMGPEGAFGAVTHSDIAELLAKEGHTIDKHAIVLDEPIKGPGVYDIPVKLGHEVTATVKLWVAEEPA